jgi:diguanylate cyclase (GGDEF)-like protein/PAS domain S-box-containing protein
VSIAARQPDRHGETARDSTSPSTAASLTWTIGLPPAAVGTTLVLALAALVLIGMVARAAFLSGNAGEFLAMSAAMTLPLAAIGACALLVILRHRHRRLLAVNHALTSQSADLRAVFAANPHPMWIYDRETLDIVGVNQAAVRDFGYREAEFLAMTACDLRPPEDVERFRRHAASADADRVATRWRLRRCDGATFVAEVRGTAIEFAGRPARLVTALDITEQRRTESTKRLAQAAFDSVHEAIVITAPDGPIIAVNPAFTRMSGYDSAACVGRKPDFLLSDRHDTKACVAMLLELQQHGHWHGEVWSRRKDGSQYATWVSVSAVRDEQGRIRNYLAVARDLSDRKEAEDRIARLVQYDELTSLPNRRLLEERLRRALSAHAADGQELGLVFVNLDHVKHVNDALGHTVGDAVLRTSALRLALAMRGAQTVARWGGDEFVIVLPATGPSEAFRIAQEALARLSEPCELEGHTLSRTASAGISMFPRDGAQVDTLLRNASAAVHHAKRQGGNCAHFFRPELNVAIAERHAIENALRLALPERKLSLHYQPQIRLADGAVVGMEALVRWHSAQLGPVPPSRFLPIAEAHGLMEDIGAWILTQACAQAARWRAQGALGLRVAVNMSAAQLRSPRIVDIVRAALASAAVAADAIEIEVTESFALELNEAMRATFDAILALGVRFAVDDFGTGYSSLAYLQTLPVHALKIDRSFVQGMLSDGKGRALAGAMVGIGHNFGLRVVAEGVETAEQRAALEAMECDEAQGYLFAAPMSAADATAWLRDRWRGTSMPAAVVTTAA